MRYWRADIFLAVAGVLCSTAGAKTFTLSQVLSAPFPSGMIAAPAGGRVAWVFNERGARNVWVAEKDAHGAFAARPLTKYAGDDGTDLGELAWSPSGATLVFTRAGDFEGGPAPNPSSLVSGAPKQEIWRVGLGGDAPRRIGPGHGAAVSPRGDMVAYLLDGQVWTAPLAGGALAQAMHDRGEDSALSWSPDGEKLVFVSTRAGRTAVGVLDLIAKRVAWMAPSLDSDMFPEWSPDGHRIAFVRIPAGEGAVDFREHKAGAPWSVWVCDPATGEGSAVWHAQSGAGSIFHGTLGDRALMWTAQDQLVFPWERTGWVHLYAVPAKGGTARELTTGGAFEVFNTALSGDRTRIAYSTNAGDPDRWHVWEVSTSGSTPRRRTAGVGIEDYPVFTSDLALVALHSDGQAPVRPVAVAPDGRMQDVAPDVIPRDFPVSQLVQPQLVQFEARDGLNVHGQLFMARGGATQKHPAILFFHGGPYRQMLPAWHPMDAYSFMYGFNQYLAQQGYIVLSVNYRGGIGYGLDFREAPGFGAGGASELKDIEGAAAYLRGRNDVDRKRIGIWGGSYGGLMTALGLARDPDDFAAGVDYAGVHDWRVLLPHLSGAQAQLAYDSSAIASVKTWRAPVLIAHNDDDRDVPFAQSIELAEALRKQGVQFDQLVIPDEGHVMLRAGSWLRFFDGASSFFRKQLGGQQR